MHGSSHQEQGGLHTDGERKIKNTATKLQERVPLKISFKSNYKAHEETQCKER